MKIEITYRFSPDKVHISANNGFWTEVIANSLVVIKKGKDFKIVDIGKTYEGLALESPEYWDKNKEAIEFVPLYSSEHFSPNLLNPSLWLYTRIAHRKVRKSGPGSFFFSFIDRFAYSLFLPQFESIEVELREMFIYDMLSDNKTKSISINGKAVPWKKWHLSFAHASYLINQVALIYLILIGLLFTINQLDWSSSINSIHNLWIVPIGVMLVFIISFLIESIWVIICKALLPKRFVLLILEKYKGNSKLGRITNDWLVNLFLS